tara:strand:+ start:347 stop:631 length:285 start_codon:yes stop_codon:yes gene_type:complete
MKPLEKSLRVDSYEDLRDSIATTGIFEMLDCRIEIWCPLESDALEVEKMVKLVESMVHVTDVKIGSKVEDTISDSYRIVITEASNPIARFRRER